MAILQAITKTLDEFIKLTPDKGIKIHLYKIYLKLKI